MALDKELIDKLLEGYQKPEDLIGETGLLRQLTKALVERAMNAELTHHLGYVRFTPSKLTWVPVTGVSALCQSRLNALLRCRH